MLRRLHVSAVTHTHSATCTHSADVGAVQREQHLAGGRWGWAKPEQDSGEEEELRLDDQDLHLLKWQNKISLANYIFK